VVIPSPAQDDSRGPWISWHFEPLPKTAKSEVTLRLGTALLPQDELRGLYGKLAESRPEAASWISAWHENSVLDIFEARPVTSMVYAWLKRDLQKVQWFK
jgi:hypothetical protein